MTICLLAVINNNIMLYRNNILHSRALLILWTENSAAPITCITNYSSVFNEMYNAFNDDNNNATTKFGTVINTLQVVRYSLLLQQTSLQYYYLPTAGTEETGRVWRSLQGCTCYYIIYCLHTTQIEIYNEI